jgi:hypothetical protein
MPSQFDCPSSDSLHGEAAASSHGSTDQVASIQDTLQLCPSSGMVKTSIERVVHC